ncbi:MAG: T9SS type A sorting domain-containing protein, partial [Flavobacteriia bacterium]
GCAAPSCSRDAFISNLSNEPILISGQTYNTKDLTIQPGASLTLQANSTLNICGNFYNYGTLNADPSSTIVFNGTGNNQIISGSFTGANRFGNLKIDKTSATYSVTINNDIEVGGTFTTNSSTSVFNTNGKYISLAGNFVNNNGNTTFSGTSSTGTLEFNGASLQTYNQGSSQLDLNNVIVNNTAAAGSGVTLSSNLFIKTATGTLTFSNGTITTGSYRVDVANTAAACVSNGTSTSYVDGNLRRYLLGSGTYEWPVGIASKGFQRATTAFSTNSIGYLDGRFDTWPVTAGYPPTQGGTDCSVTYNQAAMNNGYWTLTANSGTGNYNMTLYPTNETNIGVNWTVMKRSSLATSGWLLDGTCVTSTSSQITRNGLSGFSVFSVAQSTTALPVELIQFSGEKVDEDNLLTWKTATEHNNDYFTLERSADGFIFEAIATIAAAGNSTTEKLYSQFDIDPFRGVSYYRLKQTDINGSFSYSNTISLSRDYMESSVSELFPNPTSTDVNFEFNAQKATDIEVHLLDNSGRLVNKYMYHAVAGKNTMSLDLNNVSRGLYTVVFHSELLVKTEMRKLIKR